MTHEECRDELALAALGLLDAADASAVGDHVAGCGECSRELAALRETAAALTWVAAPAEPPSAMRERLLAAARSSSPPPGRAEVAKLRRRPRTGTFAGGLAIAAAVAGLVLVDLRLSNRLVEVESELSRVRERSDFLSSPEVATSPLAGTSSAPSARGKVVLHRDSGRTMLICSSLPQAPDGKAYQLWFVGEGHPYPGPVFRPDPRGRVVLDDRVPPESRAATRFAVTLEPARGTAAPTGETILAGGER
ncbi:MAG: hypothetical protein QOD06_2816 [Candidatus Binatota bacterium]|jgi:anti-sigma-K factor RskA|nr:hypothetical protein [Candidatus Binatota bacterium]